MTTSIKIKTDRHNVCSSILKARPETWYTISIHFVIKRHCIFIPNLHDWDVLICYEQYVVHKWKTIRDEEACGMQRQKQTLRCSVCYTLGPDRFPALRGPLGLFTDSHVAVLACSIYTIKAQHVCWISRQDLSEHPWRTNSVCEPAPSFPQQTQQRIQIKPGQGTSSLCLEHTSE